MGRIRDSIFRKPQRRVNKVFIHCSASSYKDHDDISVIRKWHVDERGWRDVGYHYFITFDGTIQRGRNIEWIPAAQRGHNEGSIAICLHGRVAADFTPAQFKALQRLCRAITDEYSARKKLTFHGHCEVSDKTCPVFDYKEVLNLDERGRLNGGSPGRRLAS